MTEKRDVMDCLFHLMRITKRHMGRSPGRSHGDNRLLRAVARNEGVSSRALADILDIRPSSLTEALSRLEEHGEVERRRDEKDGRVVNVHITDAGRRQLEKSAEARQKAREAYAACLSEEERQVFCALCDKLSHYLSAQPSQGNEKKGECANGRLG